MIKYNLIFYKNIKLSKKLAAVPMVLSGKLLIKNTKQYMH